MSNIEIRVGHVLDRLNEAVSDLTNRMTGGPSIGYARFVDLPVQPGQAGIVISQYGLYPVYEMRVSFERLDAKFTDWATYKESTWQYEVGSLSPDQSRLYNVDIGAATSIDLAVRFYARNGNWWQVLLGRKTSAGWRQAWQVWRDTKLEMEHVDGGYPEPRPVKWPKVHLHTIDGILERISPG